LKYHYSFKAAEKQMSSEDDVRDTYASKTGFSIVKEYDLLIDVI
jgi:hypothetical protein